MSEPPDIVEFAAELDKRPNRLWRKVPTLLAQAILLVLAVAPAWAYGGVFAHFQAWCLIALLAVFGCWVILLPDRSSTPVSMPLAVIPLFLALGLGQLQLIPLPAGWWARIAPQAAACYAELMPADGWPSVIAPLDANRPEHLPADSAHEHHPLSIYPLATRRELALLAMGVAAFVLGARFFQREKPLLVLLGVAGLNGAAVAFYGLVQKISHAESYLGYDFNVAASNPFGPFMNRNNGAGYLNLSLGCTIGLLYWIIAHARSQSAKFATGIPLVPSTFAERLQAAWLRLAEVLAQLNATILASCFALGLILAGIAASMSRGGWIALAAATVLALFAMRAVRGMRIPWWPLLVIAGPFILLVSWLGILSHVQQRAGSLLNVAALAHDARIANWSDSLHAAADAWPLGTGLGTYGYAYLPYQQVDHGAWFKHAENQYIEALVSGGLVGLALLLTEVLLVSVAVWKLLARCSPQSLGLAVCGLLVIASQALQSLVDFGLYTPANLLLMGLLCGAICGRAALLLGGSERSGGSRWCALPAWPSVVPACLLVSALATSFAWHEMAAAGAIEDAVEAASWTSDDQAVPAVKIEQAIDRLTSALRRAWDDAAGQMRVADLWIHLYRLRSFEILRRELPQESDAELWRLTDLAQLHARAAGFALVKNEAELSGLRRQPVVIEYLDPAWRHLLWARAACPWFARVHLDLAALCFLAGNPLEDQTHLERLRRVNGTNPNFLYSMAIMDLDAERFEQAYRELKAGWPKKIEYEAQLLDTLEHQLTVPQILERVLPDSPEVLLRLARDRYNRADQARSRAQVLERARHLISAVERTPAERFRLRGMLAAMLGDLPLAVAEYRRAVALEPEAGGWQEELRRLESQLPAATAP